MSCDWHVYCRTCSDQHYFSDANHRVDFMRELVKHSRAIAGLAELMNDAGGEITFDTSWGPIRPEWFAQHVDHDLTVIDEYGVIDDGCREHAKCGSCGTHHRCALKRGHEGPCVPAKAR